MVLRVSALHESSTSCCVLQLKMLARAVVADSVQESESHIIGRVPCGVSTPPARTARILIDSYVRARVTMRELAFAVRASYRPEDRRTINCATEIAPHRRNTTTHRHDRNDDY